MAKAELRAELEELIGREGALKARRDPHARRKPRPCGLTVHPGRGCPNACLYCYVGDILGTSPSEPEPLPLSGPELAYALVSNPYFVPGHMGTFLAMGAICDPFHPALAGKTLDILDAVARYLGNPTQFSTKMVLGPGLAAELAAKCLSLSPLITIVTLERAKELEPRAPPPEERLRTIRELRKAGLKPTLFLRPLIPGLVEHELEELVFEARKAGAVGVVVGTLRVSKAILARLRKLGLDKAVRARLKREPPLKGLVAVSCPDLKEEALKIAREKGLLAFKAACCANAYCAGVPCADLCWLRGFCTHCPNNCPEKLPEVDEGEVLSALKAVYGLEATEAAVEPAKLVVWVRKKAGVQRALETARIALEVATRRPILFKLRRT